MIKELPGIYDNKYLKVGETYKCKRSGESDILVHGSLNGWVFSYIIPKKYFYKSFIKVKSVW